MNITCLEPGERIKRHCSASEPPTTGLALNHLITNEYIYKDVCTTRDVLFKKAFNLRISFRSSQLMTAGDVAVQRDCYMQR